MAPVKEQNVEAIMLRAKLTRAEWEDFRVLALRSGQSTSDLVGSLIRAQLRKATK